MDNKPSLSQYFGESGAPPPNAAQFFDEIGTSPSDMIQSVYLGDSEAVGAGSGAPGDLPDPATFFDSIAGAPPLLAPAPPALLADTDALVAQKQPEDVDGDRRRDAWIPSEETTLILDKVQSAGKGSFFPDREQLTMPGVMLEEELADGLQEVAARHLGVSAAGARGALRAEHVSRDEAGLRELLRAGCLRAALNLSGALLAGAQQGAGRARRASRHSARTLQLWLCRLALMLRLRLLEPLRREAEPFGDLDKPDMYYRFYPESGARRGSLAPFALRLLLAELPAHGGRPELALERLYAVRAVVRRMLANLRAGRAEDGAGPLEGAARADSLRLWAARDTRVAHSLVNCALGLREYRLAGALLEAQLAAAAGGGERRALAAALGRVWLQAGHVARAAAWLARAAEERAALEPAPDAREWLDRGLLEAARGEWAAARESFVRARDQDPGSLAAANNLAAALLYEGRLRDALAVLQACVRAQPERALHESVLLNLCTLYELQAAHTQDKKLALLRLLCQHRADTIPDVAESLKLAPPRADAAS